MHLSELERRVLDMPAGEHLSLGHADVDELLAEPAYRPSLGQPARASHFRRTLPGGRGLHLVIESGESALHWDRYDPHGGPAAMFAHVMTESPREAFSLFAAGIAVLRRLGG
ncbi:MAG TPA: hypothetical protein VLN49_16680 [Gemmatimonadaceae bacterium]|nr:hypothetical protein [Gemmatimonadaceae bacterium]